MEYVKSVSDNRLLETLEAGRWWVRTRPHLGREADHIAALKRECRRRGLMAESRKAKPRFPRAAG